MKMTKMMCLIFALVLMLATSAIADGYSHWMVSQFNGYVQLASYAGDYDGWLDISGFGGVTIADEVTVRVISRNASIWAQPKTNSKKLGTAKNGQELRGIPRQYNENGYEYTDGIYEQGGFYAIEYNGQTGWINSAYAVLAPLEIVLMEGNVPAYCAPDRTSKRVGSLNKQTRYTVLGFYNDFYVINLREAAAYIPMDVKHYDSCFERMYHGAMTQKLVVNRKTQLRTGPGDDYAKIRDLKSGQKFNCWDTLGGWCLVWDDDNGTYAYIWSGDATLSW